MRSRGDGCEGRPNRSLSLNVVAEAPGGCCCSDACRADRVEILAVVCILCIDTLSSLAEVPTICASDVAPHFLEFEANACEPPGRCMG